MPETTPISTVHLIPDLDQLLMDLLRSLDQSDWELQTLAPEWKVKDIAAHLLDGNIRSLSVSKDRYQEGKADEILGYQELVTVLNKLNKDWVKAMRRVSPSMLLTLLEMTNKMYSEHLAGLLPFEKAVFPVAWAGESQSLNWFHIAREYTEKWHHQQQIRNAVGGISPLFEQRFFKPYLDTSLWPLSFFLHGVKAEEGDTFIIEVSGPGGGEWYMRYSSDAWSKSETAPSYAVTKIRVDDQVIWRIFSRQISDDELKNRVFITGKKEPAEAFLKMKAVMV